MLNISISTHSSIIAISRLPEPMGDMNRFSCQKSLWCCRTREIIFPVFPNTNSSILSKKEGLLIWKLLEKMKHQVTLRSTRLGLFLAFAILSVGRGLAVLSRNGNGCRALSLCCISGPLRNASHAGSRLTLATTTQAGRSCGYACSTGEAPSAQRGHAEVRTPTACFQSPRAACRARDPLTLGLSLSLRHSLYDSR